MFGRVSGGSKRIDSEVLVPWLQPGAGSFAMGIRMIRNSEILTVPVLDSSIKYLHR